MFAVCDSDKRRCGKQKFHRVQLHLLLQVYCVKKSLQIGFYAENAFVQFDGYEQGECGYSCCFNVLIHSCGDSYCCKSAFESRAQSRRAYQHSNSRVYINFRDDCHPTST
jgi:hypothetical protein